MDETSLILEARFVDIKSETNGSITVLVPKNLIVERSTFLRCITNNNGSAIHTDGVHFFYGKCIVCTYNSAIFGLCCYFTNAEQTIYLDFSSFCFNEKLKDTNGYGTNYYKQPIISTDVNYSHNTHDHITGIILFKGENNNINYHNFVSNVASGQGLVLQVHYPQTSAYVCNSNFIDNDNGNNFYGLIRAYNGASLFLQHCFGKNNKADTIFAAEINGKISAENCCFDKHNSNVQITFISESFTSNLLRTNVCPHCVKSCGDNQRRVTLSLVATFALLCVIKKR